MRKGTLLLITAILAIGAPLGAGEIYKVLNGPKDFYFGHISLTDIRRDGLDPVVQREGAKATEPASLNLPLGPGDTIRTSKERRVEIQFDNGTVVRLEGGTELKIESILAQGLSSNNQMSNLVLAKGRVSVSYKEYSGRELFQIITPKAALKFSDHSAGVIGLTADGSTDVRMLSGQATAIYGAGLDNPKKLALGFKERVTFAPDNRFSMAKPLPADEFEMWNQSLDKESAELQKGRDAVPKMIRRLFPAIYDWAGRFADRYGKWIYDDFFGFAWRPYYNDAYPAGTWRPFNAGRWSYYRNGMYWIPTEPWGWIPYHLGVWHWNAKQGWFWIPGTDFSPAWVDWAFIGGTAIWRPWTMWDLGVLVYPAGRVDFYRLNQFSSYWNWRYNAWWTSPIDGGPTGLRGGEPFEHNGDVWTAFLDPLPKATVAGLKSLMAALQNGDPAAVESFRALDRFANVVDGKNLLASDVAAKAIPLESFLATIAALPVNDRVQMQATVPSAGKTWPEYFASLNARPNEKEIPAGGGSRIIESPLKTSAGDLFPVLSRVVNAYAPKPALRTIDWNPDVRLARKMGVSLQYQSGRNEIVSPELNLASSGAHFNERNRRNAEADRGMGTASGSGGSSSGGGAAGAGAAGSSTNAGTSSGTASAGTSTTSTSSGSSTSTGSGTGHTVIK